MSERWKPSVTVAGIIEQEGKFLLVEENTPEGLMLNNPAGHLEPGESPEQACIREVLEETAFAFTPEHLVGAYLSRFQRRVKNSTDSQQSSASELEDITYLRFAFCGQLGTHNPLLMLDEGIVRTVWLTIDEIRNSQSIHRSPLLLVCAEDYLRGQRFSLSSIRTDKSIYSPLIKN
jgi:8-oxo-dGTP pyrophosphatase MutT (NUDIX family)